MYKITFRTRAAKEYLGAIIWYKERSIQIAENFVKAVDEAFLRYKSSQNIIEEHTKTFMR